MFIDQVAKMHLESGNVFTARGDQTSPSERRNNRRATGYVGQAARPPFLGVDHA